MKHHVCACMHNADMHPSGPKPVLDAVVTRCGAMRMCAMQQSKLKLMQQMTQHQLKYVADPCGGLAPHATYCSCQAASPFTVPGHVLFSQHHYHLVQGCVLHGCRLCTLATEPVLLATAVLLATPGMLFMHAPGCACAGCTTRRSCHAAMRQTEAMHLPFANGVVHAATYRPAGPVWFHAWPVVTGHFRT